MPTTVLLLDDNRSVVRSLAREIQRQGYQSVEAADAQEALQILRTSRVDVLVSDFRLSGMNGVELIRQARALQPGIATIVVSGLPEAASAAASEEMPVLGKPWKQADLLELVAR
jgi:DNA-binding NtrC family response regulator